MKRAVIVIVVMAALLVGAPWVIGNVVEDRVDRGLDSLVEAAPALGIVERKYTQGWFRSEQEVTFEVLGGVTRAVGAPARFTVHNEILHGPVLGWSGLGLARVNSSLVLDPPLRREIAERFGTEEPVEVSTRVGFLGGGTTTFSSDARELTLEDGGTLSWDDLVVDVRWSSKFDSVSVRGDWPRFEGRNPRRKSFLRLEDVVLDLDSERVKEHLYLTDGAFSIDDLTFSGEAMPATTFKKLKFEVDSTDDGDFMSVATRLGTGLLSGGMVQPRGTEFTATHCDFTVRRLHIDTLARISNGVAESYRRPAAVSMLDDDMFALLAHGPELIVDRIGFETRDGGAYLTGAIRLAGVTEPEIKAGGLALISHLDADLKFEAPQKMLENLEGGRQAMMSAVNAGYAELKGGNVVSDLEFHAGELKINGKAQGIPGLGNPVSKDGDPRPE